MSNFLQQQLLYLKTDYLTNYDKKRQTEIQFIVL